MSKIGNQPVSIAADVKLDVNNQDINVSGKFGTMTISIPDVLQIEKTQDTLIIKRQREDKKTKSLHGLYRNLVANSITGVQKKWEKHLEIVGTGYNAKLQGEDIVLRLGYSHPVTVNKVDGITFAVEGNNKIVVSGVDKQLVGQIAHQIKIIRKPDVYKGKGIRYAGEKLRIKPGKKAKTAGAA